MTHERTYPGFGLGLAALVSVAALLSIGLIPASASGSVSSVTASAYGYRAFGLTLLGGTQHDTGPTPQVTLASSAANSPQSGSATTGLVYYGPATLFTSDAISVQATGTLGTAGSAKATSSVTNANKATTEPMSTGGEALTADNISSSCSASPSGTTGSTTVTNGTMAIEYGNGMTPVTVPIPVNPPVNDTISGKLHINAATDHYHYVYNEQTTAGGVLTVNAVHEYFDGPNLTGNLIIGQVVCGVNASASGSTGSGSSGVNAANTSTGMGGTGTPADAGSSSLAPRLLIGVAVAAGLTAILMGTNLLRRRRRAQR